MKKNGECNVRNFKRFFLGISSDVPAFKVPVFVSKQFLTAFSNLLLNLLHYFYHKTGDSIHSEAFEVQHDLHQF